MIETITFLIGFILGYGIASFLLSKRIFKQFIVKTNEKGETTIEMVGRPKQKMEFLPEMTQEEVEETEKSTSMQTFLGGFKKPAKKEEEEEEI